MEKNRENETETGVIIIVYIVWEEKRLGASMVSGCNCFTQSYLATRSVGDTHFGSSQRYKIQRLW